MLEFLENMSQILNKEWKNIGFYSDEIFLLDSIDVNVKYQESIKLKKGWLLWKIRLSFERGVLEKATG